MKTEEFKKACSRIRNLYDGLVNEAEYGEEDFPLMDFCFQDEFSEATKMLRDKKNPSDLWGLMHDGCETAFALGYVIGQIFEITYPEAQEDFESIRETMRKNQLLPFLPKQPGARKVGLLRIESEKKPIERKDSKKKAA
jgi:hypothetical protein